MSNEFILKELLFLAHRIPYPPHKGDKVRSFHFLAYLSRFYRVHLGTFVDDPRDWAHVETVRAMCADAHFARLNPRMAKLRSARGLAYGAPLTLPYFRDRGLQAWVDHTFATRSIERVLVFSSSMAQYVAGRLLPGMRSVMDFVDVDSQKWAAYARESGVPLCWVYAREARTLLRYERGIAGTFDVNVFVSPEEASGFRELCPKHAGRVFSVENGVDANYFSPAGDYPNPFGKGEYALVFTGSMDYHANVDAVCWFARDIFSTVRGQARGARFFVVGANPTAAVRALESIEGVRITGAVADVRPYVAHAAVVVAPLRIAQGVQNKVLEALAMAKPVLATSAAMAGIRFRGPGVMVEDTVAALTGRALEALARPRSNYRGREFVLKHHDWARNVGRIVELIECDGFESNQTPHSKRSSEVA